MSYLAISNVSKTYRANGREVMAVAPLSLGIERGQIVTFLGPSGCGKTTLMRMVGGLETPTGGTITLDGATLGGPVLCRLPLADRCRQHPAGAEVPPRTCRHRPRRNGGPADQHGGAGRV
jgi:ABC-type Fe3+/spermidine/putrescine transport system ATPase subunit